MISVLGFQSEGGQQVDPVKDNDSALARSSRRERAGADVVQDRLGGQRGAVAAGIGRLDQARGSAMARLCEHLAYHWRESRRVRRGDGQRADRPALLQEVDVRFLL